MNKNQIFEYLAGSLQNYTLDQMVVNMALTFVLLLFIFFIYALTHKGNGTFSADFGFSIILTGLVTSVIMMVIESNLALSLGMVGALSIIRFRTAVKDPRDTSFIFWSVCTGLCAGTGGYVLGILSTVVIGVFVLFYTLLINAFPQNLLVVRADGTADYEAVVAVLKTNKVRYSVKLREVSPAGQQMIFKVSGRKAYMLPEELCKMNGVMSASLAWEGED